MRTKKDIVNDLKKIWGENWETNMALISENNRSTEILPIEQISASNNLICEMIRLDDDKM